MKLFNASLTRRIPRGSSRGGSVLLVVIGLLGLMLLLGLAFYTFTSEEQDSATIYAQAADVQHPTNELSVFFEFATEQLILGAGDSYLQSALWGGRADPTATTPERPGRNSLLAGVIGSDITPYNGAGARLVTDSNSMSPTFGKPFVDQNRDGTADADQTLLNVINYSAAANNGMQTNMTALGLLAPATDPDAGYTAPDLNSPYLSIKTTIPGTSTGGNITDSEWTVIKPSFLFPQYLRGGANQLTAAGNARRVFRPHPDHKCYNSSNARFLPAFFSQYPTSGMRQGAWDWTSPPGAGTSAPSYAWDVDNDGDGINEGIWMDLDFPVQQTIDGLFFVPLFSFTVIDADGLINLNTSGNTSGRDTSGGWTPLNQTVGGHLSRSHTGISRSEINPQWALHADPSLDPATDNTYFSNSYLNNRNSALLQAQLGWTLPPGTYSSSLYNRIATANIEWMQILHGRADFVPSSSGAYSIPGLSVSGPFTPTRYHTGRLGRDTRFNALLGGYADILTNDIAPQTLPMGRTGVDYYSYLQAPGERGLDDDRDGYLGRSTFVHPMDFWATGSIYNAGASYGWTTALAQPIVNNPSAWLRYSGYQAMNEDMDGDGNLDVNEDQNFNLRRDSNETDFDGDGRLDLFNEDLDGNGSLSNPWANMQSAVSGNLFTSWTSSLTDEFDETPVESKLSTISHAMKYDQIFSADEMAGLHFSNADWNSAQPASRLRDLATMNFRDSRQSEQIRGQFTTLSQDRIQAGSALNFNRRYDSDGDTVIDTYSEINADVDSDGHMEFPPVTINALGTDAREPIRWALREVLNTEYGSPSINGSSGFRLNPNLLIYPDPSTGSAINSTTLQPNYRSLTSYPSASALSTTDISALTPPAYTPTSWNAAQQEWWARHDRQLLARDIYVLLYILSGGQDQQPYMSILPGSAGLPFDTNSSRTLFTNERLQEMAQFAVNLVDAMDNDDVVTVFEYDRDLGDGWNLDDNPYNSSNDNTGALASGTYSASDRGVVYGIERQYLTFSEGLIIHTPAGLTSNSNLTTYDDTTERYYTFLELRNAAPFSTYVTNHDWQIRIVNPADPNNQSASFRRLRLQDATNTSVGAGEQYLIGSRSGSDTDSNGDERPAQFRVDYDADTESTVTYEAWAPRFNTVGGNVAPVTQGTTDQTTACHLDMNLKAPRSNDYSLLGDTGTSVAGNAFVDPTLIGLVGAGNAVQFRLERRARTGRNSGLSDSDHPWVEVDRISLNPMDFGLQDGDTASNLRQTRLTTSAMQSRERKQPLDRNDQQFTSNMTYDAINDSSMSGAAGYPMYVQNSLNRQQNYYTTSAFSLWQPHFDRPFTCAFDLLSLPLFGPDDVTSRISGGVKWTTAPSPTAYFAQERFLRPEYPLPADSATPYNRWYRLLEYIEVPTRTHSNVTIAPYNFHTPGKINLNTIRHRGVFAGLIDDYRPGLNGHLRPDYAASGPQTRYMLYDRDEAGNRDWWYNLLVSRDGADPVTGLILPGMAHSNPFRSLSYADESITASAPLEHTILRSVPSDLSTPLTRREMFEARTVGDLAANTVDLHTRHRLLRKINNNTTTRSNVFAVWVSVGFFQAQITGSDVQIGSQLPGTSVHRAFYVIDRSLPEQAFDASTGKFDYDKFIQYRRTID